jgi:hypothetical protein
MPTLKEVFGISARPILSYIQREEVDDKFLSAVNSDHHIVVYGASKQGKTALRQKHLAEDRCEIYRCNPKTNPQQIYQHVLRSANVRIETTEVKTDASKLAGKGGWSAKASIPWFGETSVTTEVSKEKSDQRSLTTEFVDVSFSDAQTIATILKSASFTKLVILENFHYLPREVQRALSFDLKTFHEMSIRFIILGVWRESNQLLVLNSDLQDRVAEIPVEPWTDSDFLEVIEAGEAKLNIIVPDSARRVFMENAYGNIGMVQEFLKLYCILNNVTETLMVQRELEGNTTVAAALSEKAEDQRGRLQTVLEGISAKSRTDKR